MYSGTPLSPPFSDPSEGLQVAIKIHIHDGTAVHHPSYLPSREQDLFGTILER